MIQLNDLNSMLCGILNKYSVNEYGGKVEIDFYNERNKDFLYANILLDFNHEQPSLEWIGVSKRLRCKGLGSELMRSLMSILRQDGYSRLNIIKPFNDSISFYERFGLVKKAGECYIPLID